MKAVREPSWFITEVEPAIQDLREVVAEIAQSINSGEDIRALCMTGLDGPGGGGGGGTTPHNLLGTPTHADTVSQGPTQGSLIKGNATPAWDELVLGAAELPLHVNAGATDLEYSVLKVAGGGTGLVALVTNDIIYASSASTFGTLASNPLATAKFLRTVSGGPPQYHQVAWGDLDLTASDLADLATRAHSSLTGVTADQHHSQSHLLATNVALGPDHTISGGVAGMVLRASGAAAANFAFLAASDLPDVEALYTSIPTKRVPYSDGTNLTSDANFWRDIVNDVLCIGDTALTVNPKLGIRNTTANKHSFYVESDGGSGLKLRFSIENNAVEPVDVSFRNVTVGFGDTSEGLVSANFYSKVTDYGQPIRVWHAGESGGGDPAFTVNNKGSVSLYVGGAASSALQILAKGASNARFYLDEFGDLIWGDGAGVYDLKIERYASSVLRIMNNNPLVERVRLDTNGLLLVGRSPSYSLNYRLQVNRAIAAIGDNDANLVGISFGGDPQVLFFKALGTEALPTAVTDTTRLFQLRWSGAEDAVPTWATGGYIETVATENWSSLAHGNAFKILITKTGTVAPAEVLRITWPSTDVGPRFGFGTTTPFEATEVFRASGDLYANWRHGNIVDLNIGAGLRFITAAAGDTPSVSNIIADIRCLVSQRAPTLKGRIDFFPNSGNTLVAQARISAEGLKIQDGVVGLPSARLHVVDTSSGLLGSYAGGFEPVALFQDNQLASYNCTIGLQSGNTGACAVYFGSSGDADLGGILYYITTNRMDFRVNNTTRFKIDQSTFFATFSLNVDFQNFYADIDEMATPSDPALGTRRIFCDSATGKLSVRTSAGTTVSLEEQGAIGGSGAAGQAAFWTAASVLSGDNAFFWDNTQKCLCLGTTTYIPNTSLTLRGTKGWIGFDTTATTPPTANSHIGGSSYSSEPTLFLRAKQNMIICLDYANAYATSSLRIVRDAPDPSGGSRTLLTVLEDGTVGAGDSVSCALALAYYPGVGGYQVRMTGAGSPSTNTNRAVVENTVGGGSGIAHWSIKNGFLMWTPTSNVAPASFSSGTIGEMIGPYTHSGVKKLIYECRGDHEIVLDTDNDTTNAVFRISRNAHFDGVSNLFYIPATFPGETCFSADENGLVYTPARRIHVKSVADAAYTLDTWQSLDGCNDLVIAYTSLTAARTVTLPAAAAGNTWRYIIIKDESGNAGTYNISVNVAVVGLGAGPTVVVNTAYGVRRLYSNGTAWHYL